MESDMSTRVLTWADVTTAARGLAIRHSHDDVPGVFGVPRGGIPVAVMVAHLLGVPVLDAPVTGALVVDDLVDSGTTAERFIKAHGLVRFDALYRKPHSPANLAADAVVTDAWLTFPWEQDSGADISDAVIRLIQYLGEDPTREGLLDTPRRVAKAYRELTAGYGLDVASILGTTFDVGQVDQMVHVAGIEFVSLCEHHMLPFTGTAHVAYIPNGRVVGLSKIPRTVEAFARRLQVQERLTEQIADALQTHLSPIGIGVSITAHHSCMGLRGAKQPNATMTTTALRGLLKDSPAAQAEFTTHARGR